MLIPASSDAMISFAVMTRHQSSALITTCRNVHQRHAIKARVQCLPQFRVCPFTLTLVKPPINFPVSDTPPRRRILMKIV